MKFEQNRVALEPRSVLNCLDLALLFCGRHLGTLFGVWALFALPIGIATYFSARYTDWGLLTAVGLCFFGSAPFGVMLAGGAARTTFGDNFELKKLIRDLRSDWWMTGKILGLRIPLGLASLFCMIPGIFLAVRWGFLVESQVLTALHEQRHDRRTNELVQLEFFDLAMRGALVAIFGGMLWVFAELTIDTVWTILFNQSLFIGRLSEVGNAWDDAYGLGSYLRHVWLLATDDPAVLTLHATTGLAAYAVCRLACFFCYIDLRVRRDCWDLELEILSEAERLRTTGA